MYRQGMYWQFTVRLLLCGIFQMFDLDFPYRLERLFASDFSGPAMFIYARVFKLSGVVNCSVRPRTPTLRPRDCGGMLQKNTPVLGSGVDIRMYSVGLSRSAIEISNSDVALFLGGGAALR